MTIRQQHLSMLDIIILTIIMFGIPIWGSFMNIDELGMNVFAVQEMENFTEEDNLSTALDEIIQLGLVLAYLYYKKFDFSRLKFNFDKKTIPHALGLFLLCAAMMDFVTFLLDPQFFADPFTLDLTALSYFFQECNFSLIYVSVLNGFFEEFFFLGLCLSVRPEQRKYLLLFSLVIRILIHVYQGLPYALVIGLGIGLLFYFYYEKKAAHNLTAPVVAHILADIFGLSIFNYILY